MRFLSVCLSISLFLGTSNGYLALWETGSPQPKQRYPFPIALFSDEDRTALETGIPVSSPEALARLMEDYLS